MMQIEPFRVVILGGGIAGLALAAFLRARTAFDVVVIEKREVGLPWAEECDYGIALASNGVAVLAELGLQDAVGELHGCELTRMHTSPAHLAHSAPNVQPYPTRSLFGTPTVFTRRSRLVRWVLARCTGSRRPVTILSPRRVVGLSLAEGTARDDSGSVHRANLLVCADGIAKLGQRTIIDALQLGGGETGAARAAQAAYMRIVPRAAIEAVPALHHLLEPDGATLSNWIHDDEHALASHDTALTARLQRRIILYPLDNAGTHQLLAYRPATDDILARFAGRPTSILRAVPASDALADFAMFHDEVKGLLGLTPTLDLCLVRDSEPLPRWACEAAVVVGDAAHATLPHTGQGFSQSLEDAEALSALLARAGPHPTRKEVKDVLDTFQNVRMPRAHEVQHTSRLLNGTRPGLEHLDVQAYSARILAGWQPAAGPGVDEGGR